MNDERLNILEYEQILCGKRKNFMVSFGETLTEREKQIACGNIWRYAITNILHWTPQQALAHLDKQLVEMLCLDKTYNNGKIKGFNPDKAIKSYRQALSYAFPDEIKYNEKDEILNQYYRSTNQGEFKADENSYRMQKKFFEGIDGIKRAKFLLMHNVKLYLSDLSIDEQYSFFARRNAKKWLASKGINKPLEVIYDDALNYYHDALPYRERDDLWYYNIRCYQKFTKKA